MWESAFSVVLRFGATFVVPALLDAASRWLSDERNRRDPNGFPTDEMRNSSD